MNLTPGFAPDTHSQWLDLDFELQELVLDEMERVAANPPLPRGGVIRTDVMLPRMGFRHYVFLKFVPNSRSQKLTLIGFHHEIISDPIT